MKVVKSSCAGKKKVRTCTFKPQVNIKNKREPIQTQEDINATHSEAKLQDLINEIKSNIYTKVKAVATSYEFGFDENEVDDYFFVEASATEIGEDHHEAIRVEVRGEVSYEGLEDLIEALDPIIESYDSYAYFEPVEPGIIEAYVSVDQVDMSIYGATASPDHMFYDYHGKRFSIHDNSSELRDDVIEDVYYLWKASISQQAGAYNDADEDYVYAFIRGRGVVEYYKKGKYVATSNYNLRDEDDFEQAWEYMEIILQDVCDRLIAYNKDVPDRMVYNSTSVEATEDLTDLPENFQHAYTLAKNDFMNDYKNAHVNVQIDPDDPYAEEGEISVYLSGFNPYGKKCARHIYINDSLDSDTIYQALENTAEDVGIRKGHYDIDSSTSVDASGDISMYSKEFHDAYTSAYIDFKERYPQVEVSEIYDDPSSDDNEICIEICDPSYGNCGKFYLNTKDEFVDSDYILRSFEETAEAIGIEQYSDDDIEMSICSDKNDVTSSTIKASYDGKFTCRIDHYGAFDNGHVLHGDWKKMSNEEAELLAKQYSENDPENIYYVHYDNIMDPASDYVWYQGEPYMSGDLVYKGGSVDVKGVPVSEDEVLSYTSVQADYNDKNLRALEDEWLTPPEYDDPIEHEDSEELIKVEINQVITVDVDGDYEWDDDTYVWASPDGSNEGWRSEDGVYIDDKVGVVEHIDDLIIPNVPTRPGKYRVTGLAELIYDISGIQEYRTEYGPDDYDSDIDIDHAVVSFNFRKSEVRNLKITPVRR